MADISSITLPDESSYDIKAKKSISIPFATVDNTSTKTAFTVQVPEFSIESGPRDGLFFYIRNNKVTSASGFTLNVNSWGAKPCYNANCERMTTGFATGKVFPVCYNSALVSGGCWVIGYLSDANTTYSGMTEAEYQAGTSTTNRLISPANLKNAIFRWNDSCYNIVAKSAITAGRLCAGDDTGYEMIASGVVFDLAYPIIYPYNDTASGNTITNPKLSLRGTSLRDEIGDSSWTGVAKKMVWLVGAINSAGKFVVDSSIVTQTVPTTNDGKYYIPLGILGSNQYSIDFRSSKELWAFKNGVFKNCSLAEPESMTSAEVLAAVTAGWNGSS